MAPPIGIQLYSVREQMAQDFEGTVRKIAAMGYAGVETAGFPGTDAQGAAKLFNELDLKVSSAHNAPPLGDQKNESLDTMAALGCTRLVNGKGPGDFDTNDKIKASCAFFNKANAACVENGLSFHMHNHWWEFIEIEGRLVYEVMLEELDPAICFEVDTYWVTTGGQDAAAVLKQLGDRAPLLHIKDGPCNKDGDMTAVGKGTMDFHKVIPAASNPEWLIVELDRCATDMIEAVADSFNYLKNEGFGEGK